MSVTALSLGPVGNVGCAPAVVHAIGFSPWKRPIVRRFLAGSSIVFVRDASKIPGGSTLAIWGRGPDPGNLARGIHVLHLEDGFLRSVGLGADLIRPLSWVIDRRGIHYDSSRPSDLEVLLQNEQFAPNLLERAARLRENILALGLTKYNVGGGSWHRPANIARVILVPGQVESDASLRFGAPGIRTNLGLLRAVRRANPDAYLVYRAHPEVMAGLKARGVGEEAVSQWCDEIVADVPMGQLLIQVDEVHVLTSLTGFEALLRGKSVTCYGQPFYAGWGLTVDLWPVSRRTRQLTVDQLVAGALIRYPSYVDYATGRLSTPERALNELRAWREATSSTVPWWRRGLRFLLATAAP